MSGTGDPGAVSVGERGATLIEMMVVVGLMALAAGLVFPAMQGPRLRLQSDLARSQLRADLRAASALATASGREVDVEVSSDGLAYAWAGQSRRLPAGSRLQVDTPIAFGRDGLNQGRLALLTATGGYPFVVDAATGLLDSASRP